MASSAAEDPHLRIDGVVHALSSDYDSITRCGLAVKDVGPEWRSAIVLEPTSCAMCLAEDEDEVEVSFRCECSWVGGDPDIYRGRPTCPACWHHDRRRRVVTPDA